MWTFSLGTRTHTKRRVGEGEGHFFFLRKKKEKHSPKISENEGQWKPGTEGKGVPVGSFSHPMSARAWWELTPRPIIHRATRWLLLSSRSRLCYPPTTSSVVCVGFRLAQGILFLPLHVDLFFVTCWLWLQNKTSWATDKDAWKDEGTLDG